MLSADGVRLVALRLPVIEEDGTAWVELDGERWALVDQRTRPPALTDHFVFLFEQGARFVCVVDRVIDLVLSKDLSAADGTPIDQRVQP